MIDEKSLGNIADKILFLTINCTRLGNLRTAQVTLNTNASEGMFHTAKKLIDSPELKAIAKRDGEIKNSLAKYVLPYKLGAVIVPSASGPTVRQILQSYMKVERPALVQALVDVYDERVEAAKGLLKEQFDATQYLTKEQVAAEFTFDYMLVSLTLPDTLKDEAHETIMSAAASVNDALAAAAQTMVAKLADSLKPDADGKFGKVYDKQFVVLQEFLAGFDVRNVTSNQELKTQMDKLKALLAGVDPEKVRNNEGLRLSIAEDMAKATESLTTMVQRKGRVFRDTDPEVAAMLIPRPN
jgi:hypothetical protein